MVGTEFIIRHALQEGVKITLVVNKIDRLILELRIKPADAYYKIKHTIEEINSFIRYVSVCQFVSIAAHRQSSSIDSNPHLRLSPENGNVAFASTDMNWCFTLRSFAQMYADTYGKLPPFWGFTRHLMFLSRFIGCQIICRSTLGRHLLQ